MQLSLWDHLPLENCYKLISQLKFEEAITEIPKIKYFYPNRLDEIDQLEFISNFWKEFIDEKQNPKTNINTIFNTWISYPFPAFLKSLKVKLLYYIAENFKKSQVVEEEMFHKLFFQLESHCFHQLNLELTEHLITQKTEAHHLIFYKSKALWNCGKIGDAKINLCIACWLNPSWQDFGLIKNEELRNIAQQHGVEWLPAFGYALRQLPSISFETLNKLSNLNEKAYFNAYIWMIKLQESQMQQDNKSILTYRKNIKSLNDLLFKQCMKTFFF